MRVKKTRQVRVNPGVYTARSSNSRAAKVTPSKMPKVAAGKFARFRAGKLVLAVLSVFLIIVFIAGTRITTVKVTGNTALQTADIQQLVQTNLARNPWFANYFTVGRLNLASRLPKEEARIKTVQITTTFPNTVSVKVTERQPGIIWVSANENWAVDTEGVVVGAAGSGSASTPTVIDTANIPVKVGDRVAPQRFVAFCAAIAQNMKSKTGLEIANLMVPESTSEVNVKTSKGYLVKFDTTREAGAQLDDLAAVLRTLAGKQPGQYIDLRVPTKAYYQ